MAVCNRPGVNVIHPVRRAIPSLSAITVFEAAARLGSFTAAARELGVTQAAVSRRIRGLEEGIGAPLFERAHRELVPTEAGQALIHGSNEALAALGHAIAAIDALKDEVGVTVGATLAFSHFALLPELSSFREICPEIPVRLVSQDTPPGIGGPQRIDVSIEYGVPPFSGRTVVAVLPERVMPVCSPAFARAHGLAPGHPVSMDRLRALPRIAAESHGHGWLDWTSWSRAIGTERPLARAGLSFTNYADAAYAAMASEGVLLGWCRLLRRSFAEGRLMPLGDPDRDAHVPSEAHHVLIKADTPPRPPVDQFARWASERLQ